MAGAIMELQAVVGQIVQSMQAPPQMEEPPPDLMGAMPQQIEQPPSEAAFLMPEQPGQPQQF